MHIGQQGCGAAEWQSNGNTAARQPASKVQLCTIYRLYPGNCKLKRTDEKDAKTNSWSYNDEVIEVDSFEKIDESGKIRLNNYTHIN